MAKIDWIRIPKISLAESARKAGFDLSFFANYNQGVQEEIRKRAIGDARIKVREVFRSKTGRDLEKLTRAVYVICVGWPFAVQYKGGRSEILYIGIGNVNYRLGQHLENSLFDLMVSLQGIDFTFLISVPRVRNAPNAYKHVEFLMLDEFRATTGGSEEYPLLNSNAGAEQSNVRTTIDGWKLPLKQAGKTPRWLITPTKHNEFAKLD